VRRIGMKDERLEGKLLMKDCVFVKNPDFYTTSKDDDDDFDEDDNDNEEKLNILKES
jgi:hypothetical protein